MDGYIQVLSPTDASTILKFEKARLAQEIPDEVEREFQCWNAPWRSEALDHYLALGWSFGLWQGKSRDSEFLGYFLGQALLYFRGMTQNLWVEYMGFNNQKVGEFLADLAYRAAKDKHLQKLYFSQTDQICWENLAFKTTLIKDGFVEIKTAKVQD